MNSPPRNPRHDPKRSARMKTATSSSDATNMAKRTVTNDSHIEDIDDGLIDSLRHQVKIGYRQILSLHRQFKRMATPPARRSIDYRTFSRGMKKFGVVEPFLVQRHFAAFDLNGDELIDFREFVKGVSALYTGASDEAVEFVFRVYDIDGDGYVTRDEMVSVLRSFYRNDGFMQIQPSESMLEQGCDPKQMVDEAFSVLKGPKAESMTLEDFKRAVRTQKFVLSCYV